MSIIKTNVFIKQVKKLIKKYINIQSDISSFEWNIKYEPYSDLWDGFLKYRISNSSTPTWKRWWFRLIVKIYWDNIIPITIYSKTTLGNISNLEIKKIFKEIIKELQQWKH